MSKAFSSLRRACLEACGYPHSGLQNSFPALTARFAACAASAESSTSVQDAQLSPHGSIEESGGADAAFTRSGSGPPCVKDGPGNGGSPPQLACIPLLRATSSTSHIPRQDCRSFSAQPLPVRHADGPEPLGFVKGGYSVEQFPPDKVTALKSLLQLSASCSLLQAP